ncbi:MAG: single-stranded DNA-binding protein [Clostridia bacterium]|nr:single-stranded DNA-binding protein [Clostridia bacterium]
MMNKVLLIGNLTKDPELSTTSSGISVCKFTIAVSRRFGNNETDFLPVIAWRGQAENCSKFLKKGSKAAICGSIQTRSYDANDGSKRYITEIVADEVQFLSTKAAGEEDAAITEMKPIDDALPF